MLEVEAKLRLGAGEAQRLRERLRRLGALRGSVELQADTYFGHPQRDFVGQDEALRLRMAASGPELTYKGPRAAAQATKSRTETTVRVRDDPTSLLAALGFVPALQVRKRREQWSLGDVQVAIDAVEGLGEFVEVEVMAASAGADTAARRVESALVELQIATLPRLDRSYAEMLAQTR